MIKFRDASAMIDLPSGRVDDAHPDHPQSRHARHEEIVAAARLDELRNAGKDEGGLAAFRIHRNDEFGIACAIAQERAGIVSRIGIKAVIEPLLLNEFKLTRKAGADGHEDDAMFA